MWVRTSLFSNTYTYTQHQVINPALNTVPYTFILLAYITAYSKHGNKTIQLETLWEKISGYLETYDARQIRYLGSEFMQIVEAAAQLGGSAGQVNLKHGRLSSVFLTFSSAVFVLLPSEMLCFD